MIDPSRTKKTRLAEFFLLAEPIIVIGLALVYIWFLLPTHNDQIRVPFITLIVLIPLVSTVLHKDRLTELGIRFDNLAQSARDVAIITALGAATVLLIGRLGSAPLVIDDETFSRFLLYPFWGFAQQFAMQSFTYRRIRACLGHPIFSALVTAVLFGAVHLPNWMLMAVTALGGFVLCCLFENRPNLFTLALCHGWLATLLRAAWPGAWMHNLRIGPSYWTWTP